MLEKIWETPCGPIHWLKNAGHNANTDEPQLVNRLIEELVRTIEPPKKLTYFGLLTVQPARTGDAGKHPLFFDTALFSGGNGPILI